MSFGFYNRVFSIVSEVLILTALFDQAAGGDAKPPAAVDGEFPSGWTSQTPRAEIRPTFSWDADGGPHKAGCFVISHDDRDGLDGWFQKSFNVTGGSYHRFEAVRRISRVSVPRRSALVRVLWQDDAGKMVSANVPERQIRETGNVPSAEPEHPVDGETDAENWTAVGGIYRVPDTATRAVVELHLQWAPGGQVEWSEVRFDATESPPSRRVRLAAVHYQPTGKSIRKNCEEFSSLIADAGRQKADLVVLGETVPSVGISQPPDETAESIPGASTEYFGELAKQHHVHIVLSLYEREEHLVYNTAVLIGPDGQLLGKYRKSRKVMPISSSTLQGLFTWPEMQKSLVPTLLGRPMELNQVAPRRRIVPQTAMDSTLLMVDGAP